MNTFSFAWKSVKTIKSIATTYSWSKWAEAKYKNQKQDEITEKHRGIYICGCIVGGFCDLLEELCEWPKDIGQSVKAEQGWENLGQKFQRMTITPSTLFHSHLFPNWPCSLESNFFFKYIHVKGGPKKYHANKIKSLVAKHLINQQVNV